MYYLPFEFFFLKQDFDPRIIFLKFWILKFRIKDKFENFRVKVKIDMMQEKLILDQREVG